MSAPGMTAAGKTGSAPVLVWPLAGRFALPSSTLAIGALRQAGVRALLVYGPPADPATAGRARAALGAARALARLRTCRIGSIGGLFANLVSCRYDPAALKARLGVSAVAIGYDEVRAASDRVSDAEIARARQEIAAAFAPASEGSLPLDPGLRLHIALKRISSDRQIDAFAPECWSGLPPALGLNPCLGFVEDAYEIACEGDVQLCVGLLAVRAICGRPGCAGDLYDCDLDGVVTLVHCGAPASVARRPGEAVLGLSSLAAQRGFTTVTCRPSVPEGPATLVRLSGPGCDSMHLAGGRVVGCDTSADLRVRVKLDVPREAFLERCEGNHYVAAAGDVRPELRLWAQWSGITVQET
jgi:L-fucose isomerase-like protein